MATSKISDSMLALRKRLEDNSTHHHAERTRWYEERNRLQTAKRDADQALYGEKTKFAEYRRNVELRDNLAANLRKRLEIASIGPFVFVKIDHYLVSARAEPVVLVFLILAVGRHRCLVG